MKRFLDFLKKDTVLAAAWLLALVSMAPVPPDSGYLDYIDVNTLMLLFALMAVMAGLQRLGLFRRLQQTAAQDLHGAVLVFHFAPSAKNRPTTTNSLEPSFRLST